MVAQKTPDFLGGMRMIYAEMFALIAGWFAATNFAATSLQFQHSFIIFKVSRRFLDMVWEDWTKIMDEYYKQIEEQGPVDYDAYWLA